MELNDLHGDLLSFGNAARQGRAFHFSPTKERRHKKAFDLPQGEETKAERANTGTEETPLPSCLWRDSRPGHTARDLMSARKQVF